FVPAWKSPDSFHRRVPRFGYHSIMTSMRDYLALCLQFGVGFATENSVRKTAGMVPIYSGAAFRLRFFLDQLDRFGEALQRRVGILQMRLHGLFFLLVIFQEIFLLLGTQFVEVN